MRLQAKMFNVRFLTQLVILICAVVFIGMALAGMLFSFMLNDILKKNIGQQAMTVAKLAAMDKQIIDAFALPDPSAEIQPIAERMRLETGASYVVIGNKDNIRYSHYDPEQIGKVMGTTNEPVFLDEMSVVYEGSGISGPALKAKTPIRDHHGDIIGVSSVGFLLDEVDEKIAQYQKKVIMLTLVLFLLGFVLAYLIALRVKNLTLGLEPSEISFLYKEREATLESIRDAIVAVDMEEKVVTMNRRARELLHRDILVGHRLSHHHLREIIRTVTNTGQGHSNGRIFLDSQVFAMQVEPILQNDVVKGAVITFRPESEIEQLTNEFSEIKTFSENMRAQNHEYLNKLNIIYGLISLKHYDKAIEIISEEVKERQNIIAFLMTSVKVPLIAACLLGKINRSKELKVNLEIDADSHLTYLPPDADSKALVTIVANIIDNGMESAREKNEHNPIVKVSFTDLGNDIVFDIEDNGRGVTKEQEKLIFVDGYTTKSGENHGIGLTIAKHALQELNGQLFIDKSSLGGARFTIVVPKK
ncbi:sensor histidine kinase [Paenibacillus sp. GSMTC-2017]|uniref:ATP-binding protein n=1 Tax=Paenibacillus sp. GSMTC-2017 TaxID=2794350 RepID=UPI0018D8F37E|nr:sensor histidine kinase [Paenibacillus sp. GSMTC-2017]MBH5316980.1 sensor histidine kinase [Paenibacillus sp. GSMTC-2017]